MSAPKHFSMPLVIAQHKDNRGFFTNDQVTYRKKMQAERLDVAWVTDQPTYDDFESDVLKALGTDVLRLPASYAADLWVLDASRQADQFPTSHKTTFESFDVWMSSIRRRAHRILCRDIVDLPEDLDWYLHELLSLDLTMGAARVALEIRGAREELGPLRETASISREAADSSSKSAWRNLMATIAATGAAVAGLLTTWATHGGTTVVHVDGPVVAEHRFSADPTIGASTPQQLVPGVGPVVVFGPLGPVPVSTASPAASQRQSRY